MVDGFIELAERGIDLEFAEHRVHAEGACFVGDDRHDAGTELLVAHHGAQRGGEDHGRGDFASARPLVEVVKD